jgi:hypothetical protein
MLAKRSRDGLATAFVLGKSHAAHRIAVHLDCRYGGASPTMNLDSSPASVTGWMPSIDRIVAGRLSEPHPHERWICDMADNRPPCRCPFMMATLDSRANCKRLSFRLANMHGGPADGELVVNAWIAGGNSSA